jgi:hypothetical protein
VNAREPVIARLDNWIVPASIKNETMIFAVVDPENLVEEVHENNNKAWSLIGSGFGPTDTDDIISREAINGKEGQIQLFPNPIQSTAVFRYVVDSPSRIDLAIYDMQGRLVEMIIGETKLPGTYEQHISREGYESGVYFYRFRSGDQFESGKMIIMD